MYDDNDDNDDAEERFYQVGIEARKEVDAQAKEYDDRKRQKREELARLKAEWTSAQAKFTTKTRELRALELAQKKESYLDTRERVVAEREHLPDEGVLTREASADVEIMELHNKMAIDERRDSLLALREEVRVKKMAVDELSRKISLLEHEILRT